MIFITCYQPHSHDNFVIIMQVHCNLFSFLMTLDLLSKIQDWYRSCYSDSLLWCNYRNHLKMETHIQILSSTPSILLSSHPVIHYLCHLSIKSQGHCSQSHLTSCERQGSRWAGIIRNFKNKYIKEYSRITWRIKT